MLAGPFAVPGGTRKFTWYPSTAPGKPTALSTSAAFPLTVTSTGELTIASGLDGNGWPGSTPGTTGPRPLANTDRISPAAAGLDVVTREKSPEWVMAGPAGSIAISGLSIGIKWITQRCVAPPFTRRFAGSSVIEVLRAKGTPGGGGSAPTCPRAPRNAPVPPATTKLARVTFEGDPGGAAPPLYPVATIVPIGVPSLFKISKAISSTAFRTTSATAEPGGGAGRRLMSIPTRVWTPIAGWPLTA